MTQQKADPLRRKALACIREGRVTVVRVDAHLWAGLRLTDGGDIRRVIAAVRSSRDGHPYVVAYRLGDTTPWRCDCREGRRDLPCAHTFAVALVTTGVTS